MASLYSRAKNAWNVFRKEEETRAEGGWETGAAYGVRQDRPRLRLSNERSIIAGVYTRIAVRCRGRNRSHSK